MITSKQKQEEYYRALKEKDRNYEGIFFAGIKTTGIFCHPTCRARKPKFEHCEFYETAEEALLAGYESASGFNNAFTKIMGNPAKKVPLRPLSAMFISTPIGRMLCLTDDEFLYLLEFEDRPGLEREIEQLRTNYNFRIIYGQTTISQQVSEQLAEYFKGERHAFLLPLFLDGSAFQKAVWQVLLTIPSGETVSYREIALRLGDKNKVRAVGRANGSNKLAIVVPCHRVIGSDGKLTGYAGGLKRKQYLLDLEQK